jgi:hypothetical protein
MAKIIPDLPTFSPAACCGQHLPAHGHVYRETHDTFGAPLASHRKPISWLSARFRSQSERHVDLAGAWRLSASTPRIRCPGNNAVAFRPLPK